jgi:dimethylargininase
MRVALTRKVSPDLARCELTYLSRTPIDIELANAQHLAYEECLTSLGYKVESLPAEPGLPDSVFVEDAAIVLEELAVITRPGVESRRAETTSVAKALEHYRPLVYIEPPGVLDGGDALRIGKRIWVGLSGRTNAAGVQQLRDVLAPHGYSLQDVPVRGCLHLKSAVTQIAQNGVLINPDWVDANVFADMRAVEVAGSEPMGANALLIDGAIIYSSAFPETRTRLEALGIRVIPLDVSEIAKAEGGVTCCSLVFDV